MYICICIINNHDNKHIRNNHNSNVGRAASQAEALIQAVAWQMII